MAPQPASASDAQSCVQQLVFNPASGGFLPVNNFGTEQAFLNCFGWQLFIAMNWPVNPGWPANPALAGEPDPNSSAFPRVLGGAGVGGFGRVEGAHGNQSRRGRAAHVDGHDVALGTASVGLPGNRRGIRQEMRDLSRDPWVGELYPCVRRCGLEVGALDH